ncbi:hypothetical protein [Nioella nitratireducens]|uniref:hypothetical protein n=1 Tax=Nioella nitratireducens TaxID=1287720 RepID=UPI0008FD0D32|nr:hypothetical protein [Nioella nitratireducens]
MLIVLSGPVAAQTPETEPAAVAAVRAELAGLSERISPSLAPARIRVRLSHSFSVHDIAFSERYLDNWSTLLQDRWSQYDLFYATQAEVLNDWSLAVATGAVTQTEAETVLSQALERVQTVAAAMPGWQDDDVSRLTDRAAWTDMAQEVGCCDALYYHALDEADSVWAASDSPDPSAIAALQLVPTPNIPGLPDSHPAASAYSWLAARAQGLEQQGDGAAADRRALVVEAELLVRLFGLPDGVTLPVGLDRIASEECLSAQPVAPLLRLAALTEQGPLRDQLMTRAQNRLEAQAAFLETQSHASVAAVAPMILAEDMVGPGAAEGGENAPPTAPDMAITADVPPASQPSAVAAANTPEALIGHLSSGNLDSGALMRLADAAEAFEAGFAPGDTLGLLRSLGTLPEAPATNFRTMQATGN